MDLLKLEKKILINIYIHYREDGKLLIKYVGEYSDDLYNLILNNNIKAKELKK